MSGIGEGVDDKEVDQRPSPSELEVDDEDLREITDAVAGQIMESTHFSFSEDLVNQVSTSVVEKM